MSKSNKVDKLPLCYSLAYHSLSLKKDDSNSMVKDFIDHISKTTKIVDKDIANSVNRKILTKLSDDHEKHYLIQACNLELTIQNVQDLYPSLLKSKEITRDEIQIFLNEFNSGRT